MSTVEIFPGAFHTPLFLSHNEQCLFTSEILALADGAVGFYRPKVRGGGFMHCDMLCLGRHWNAMTYKYDRKRTDGDGLTVPPVPVLFREAAVRAAEDVGFTIEPDVCLINRYAKGGRMGLHQDKDEHQTVLDMGVPIVSFSIGATARFVIGGMKRRDRTTAIQLRSGDAFVMGGISRLRYHGVTRILSGTEPQELGMSGRFNLTLRQYEP